MWKVLFRGRKWIPPDQVGVGAYNHSINPCFDLARQRKVRPSNRGFCAETDINSSGLCRRGSLQLLDFSRAFDFAKQRKVRPSSRGS